MTDAGYDQEDHASVLASRKARKTDNLLIINRAAISSGRTPARCKSSTSLNRRRAVGTRPRYLPSAFATAMPTFCRSSNSLLSKPATANDLSHHPARRAAGKVAGATAEPVQAGDDQDVAFSQEVEARLKFRPGSDRGHLLLEYSLDAQPTQLFDLILEASDLIAS